MPNKKFAEKRVRQSEKRRLRNRIVKKQIKTQFKRLQNLIKDKKTDQINKAYDYFQKLCDKAVKKGVLHLNTASRAKSRAAHLIKTITTK